MEDRGWLLAVSDIEHNHAGIAPRRIGSVTIDDRVMQPVAARSFPRRRLAGCRVHSRNPPSSSLLRRGWVAHVDGDEDVICEAIEQGRGVSPSPSGVPEAMNAAALHLQKSNLPRSFRDRDVIDRQAALQSRARLPSAVPTFCPRAPL